MEYLIRDCQPRQRGGPKGRVAGEAQRKIAKRRLYARYDGQNERLFVIPLTISVMGGSYNIYGTNIGNIIYIVLLNILSTTVYSALVYYMCQTRVTRYEQRRVMEVDESLPFPLNPRNIIITTKNKTITCPFEDRVTKEQQFASELNKFWSPFLRITSF